MTRDRPICEGCGQEIPGNETIDFWASRTIFDPTNWEAAKAGEEVDKSLIGRDYVVFGTCCRHKVADAWRQFINQTTVEF
jgi:hypothetical protein